VIVALGRDRDLAYTLFRPCNWIGPGLDSIHTAKEGSSRVVTQFLGHLLRREPITLVDGGSQRRCFTAVDDGVDALLRILRNEGGVANGQIFNIGHPGNDHSVRELALEMISVLGEFQGCTELAETARMESRPAASYYGDEYQDIVRRVPSIQRAEQLLGWTPKVGFRDALRRTMAPYVTSIDPDPVLALDTLVPGTRQSFAQLGGSPRS
jgi:nucleoside-diphosphate-sugar epimerase